MSTHNRHNRKISKPRMSEFEKMKNEIMKLKEENQKVKLQLIKSETENQGYRGVNEGAKLAGRKDLWIDDNLDDNNSFESVTGIRTNIV